MAPEVTDETRRRYRRRTGTLHRQARFTGRLAPDVADALEAAAAREGRAKVAIVEDALRRHLKGRR